MKTSFDQNVLGAITLNRVFGFKPQIAHRIIENAGSIGGFFSLTEKQRDSVFSSGSTFRGKLGDDALEESAREIERLARCEAGFISIEDGNYPAPLRECEDAPIGIYYKSASPAEQVFSSTMISIVGTRDVSSYGKDCCRRVVEAISRAPEAACIVSGLALGVDGIAHERALQRGLPTIAVLPTGIETFSPRTHFELARKISETPGCALVSDFPIGFPVTAANFIRRNRIIAGLSRATIVIESKKHGGSLITARSAFAYDRDVFVIPGRIDDVRSQGCNNLIEQKMAEPIANFQMLSARLGLGYTTFSPRGTFPERVEKFYANLPSEMLDDILLLANNIMEHRGIDVESLASLSGLTYNRGLSLCMMLQKDGFLEIDLLQRCQILTKNE